MKIFKIAAISILALSIVGCASSSRVTKLEGELAANQAQNAQQIEAVRAQAQSATDLANEAQRCCNANSEKMDRMFKATMNK